MSALTATAPTTDVCVYTDLDWTLAELARVEAEAESIEARKRELRMVVASFMADADATSIMRPLATVKLIPGSVRATYDRRALDTLCRDDADLAFRLSPYRKETTTAPSVRVEWHKEEAS